MGTKDITFRDVQLDTEVLDKEINIQSEPEEKAKKHTPQKDIFKKTILFYYWISPLITVIILNVLQMPYLNLSLSELWFGLLKFLVSAVFVFSVQMFLSALFHSKRAGIILTNTLFFVLAFASVVMLSITEEPLLPVDFVMAGQINRVAKFVDIPVGLNLIFGILLFFAHILSYFILHKKYAVKMKFRITRYVCMILVGTITVTASVYCMCFNYSVRAKVFPAIHCRISEFESATDYRNNGFVLNFFPRVSDMATKTPEAYNKENVEKLKAQYENVNLEVLTEVEDVTVIAIQAESWWDPTKMSNFTYSTDPFEDIRALEASGKGHFGTFVTPSFGCNTCIPEFEYLTGVSTKLLPSGGYPYTQFVKQPVNSLASIFKAQGYSAVALHTYDKNYYDRSKGYPFMGFDKFMGHKDMEDPVKKGTYISDMYFADQIIKQYEEKGDGPMFLYAISMQNHGNYLVPRYDSYDIQVDADKLTEDELSGLREAVQGVYDINNSYMHLVNYFENVSEPVLIVMYGDHLPFMGSSSSTFVNLEYMKSGGLSKNPHMYETPYVIWSNYDISEHKIREIVGPQFLGIETLKLAGIEDVPWEYAFIDEFYSKYPVYQHTTAIDADGKVISPDSVNPDDVLNYEIVQHHLLFGGDN